MVLFLKSLLFFFYTRHPMAREEIRRIVAEVNEQTAIEKEEEKKKCF